MRDFVRCSITFSVFYEKINHFSSHCLTLHLKRTVDIIFKKKPRKNIRTLRVCLIITWKRKIKIVYFCEKLKNKLRHEIRTLFNLWFFP